MAIRDMTFPKIPETLEELRPELKKAVWLLGEYRKDAPRSDDFMRPMMLFNMREQHEWVLRLTIARQQLKAKMVPAMEPMVAHAA